MSDRRLTTLDPDISSLLDAERSIPHAPAGARERVLGRLSVTVGAVGAGLLAAGAARVVAAAPVSVAPAALPPSPAPSPVAAPVAAPAAIGTARPASFNLAVSCLVGALVGGGIIYFFMRRPEPAPATPAPSIIALAQPGLVAPPPPKVGSERDDPAAPDPSAAPPPIAQRTPPVHRPHHVHPSSPPSAPRALEDESGLDAERAILDSARTALALGDVKGALAATRRHEHRFPNGQLVDARESLLIRALAASGDTVAARARGESFHRRFPASIFLPAVDATLQSLP